jgi:hypothetical protein
LLFKFALEYALRRKRKPYSITGQDGPSGLQEVEAPRIFRQSAHEGDKFFNPAHHALRRVQENQEAFKFSVHASF